MPMQNRATTSLPQRLYASLTMAERFAVIGLACLAFVAAGLLGREYWLGITVAQPAPGGTYTEGLVASSPADVQPTIDVLTNVGLTWLGEGNAVLPGLAERWEVLEEGKRYVFFLRPEADLGTVRQVLSEAADRFPDIAVAVNDDRTVSFTLPQPFAPFLATTATPIFPYGPYRIESQDRGRIVLARSPQSIMGAPYLDKIELKVYADSFRLTQALSAGDIDGVADVSAVEQERLLSALALYDLALPRRTFAFFNVSKDQLKSEEVRRRLKVGESLDQPITITLVTLASPRYEQYAQDLVARWKPLGVTVIVETRTATDLAKEVLPKRAYDVLIYGLDFGPDPDPYPFWHSSQISESGLNLSNFANLDADRILERARKELNPAARIELNSQFQQIFDRLVPAIELERISTKFAVAKSVRGVQGGEGLTLADRYRFVVEWYERERRVRSDGTE